MLRLDISGLRVLTLLGLGVATLGGCGGTEPTPPPAATKPEVDLDDRPITEADVPLPRDFADAVVRIKGYRDAIKEAVTGGRPTKAHRSLDELDIVLNWLPELARDGGVPKANWEEVNTTAQRIQELFNKVHGQIDAKQTPDYGAIAPDVDAAIAKLAAVPVEAMPVPSAKPDAPK